MSSYTNTTTTQVNFGGEGKNPEVSIGSDLNTTELNGFTRKIFTRTQYSGQPFFVFPPDKENFLLVGQNSFFLYPMAVSFPTASNMPSFISKSSYSAGFAKNPTGFITAQQSLMPKLLVPSQYIIDNGLKDSIQQGVFNWTGDIKTDKVSSDDAQSSVIFLKNPGNIAKEVRLKPSNCYVPSEASDIDSEMVIGGGAFQVAVSFLDTDIPNKTLRDEGTPYPNTYLSDGYALSSNIDEKIQPRLVFYLGDLEISIDMDGRCVGSWMSGEKNTRTINLVSGTGEECIPQAKTASTDRSKTFVLTVYPLWGGVVIQSGVQTAQNIIHASAVYLPVIEKASLFQCAILKTRDDGTTVPFDPEQPDQIYIKTSLNGKSLIPNLGDSSTEMIVKLYNCNCRLAFAPLYFHKGLKLVHALAGNKNINGYEYVYKGYPIWTNNGTQYFVNTPIDYLSSGLVGPAEFTEIFTSSPILLRTPNDQYQRVSGEIFGEIVEMQETVPTPTTPAPEVYTNGITNWSNYITNINISSGLESISGSISFDRYGAEGGVGSDESIPQFVGKISIDVKGSYNTNGSPSGDSSVSTIFQGYTWTSSENKSKDGSEVVINLVGPEKRLDDVNLINPPIFDGHKFVEVAEYLCKFAGVDFDLSNADQNVRLQMSTDPIETVCFNWTTGMDCRQALEQICRDTAHGWIPRDGKIFFFQRQRDGRPSWQGKVWTGFDGTNIQTIDKNPDFERLRNQIILIGMRNVTEDAQKNFPSNSPLFPITTMINNPTNPNIPWPKRYCYTLPGYLDQKKVDEIATNIASYTSVYDLIGTTTIPGADIKPLDIFLDYVVIGVTHNIDLVSKVWTTSLNLQERS